MTPRPFVLMHVETGSPTVGLWCERCLLPSVIQFPLLQLTDRGVTRIATITRCLKESA